MVFYELSPRHPSGIPDLRLVELIAFGFIAAHAVYLVNLYLHGLWIVPSSAVRIPPDFVDFWSAGRHVLAGDPAAAYDFTRNTAFQIEAIGHQLERGYPWFYPPTFLFIAALLALFSYVPAYVGWIIATSCAYVAAIRGIIGHRIGILFACAFPGVLPNLVVGQNGFVTATLLAGTLGFMERRPTLAGCCLGLMTYKPQLGILFPLVLLVSGRWRVFWSAAITAIVVAAAAWFAFGTETWEAFWRSLPEASQLHLANSGEHWAKMQSVFTFLRWLGASESLAWTAHAAFVAACALALCQLWRSQVSFNIKAAALGVCALLATPYLFLYDIVALAVPLAFIIREARITGFLPYEMAGIGAACLLVFIFPAVIAPVGLAATLVVGILVVRRALRELRPEAVYSPH